MKMIAYDKSEPRVTLDELRLYLREDVSNVWRFWKAGIVRENYSRADVGGVIIVVELGSVEEAQSYTDFPLSKAGLLEWHFLAFAAPLPLEFLFDPQWTSPSPWTGRSKRDPIGKRLRGADDAPGMVQSREHGACRLWHAVRHLPSDQGR